MSVPLPGDARLRAMIALASLIAGAAGACHRSSERPPLRFLHTFGNEETKLFNDVASERGIAVEASLVPFARGRQVIGEILRAGTDCPDLIRIDATWLRQLVTDGLVAELPRPLA